MSRFPRFGFTVRFISTDFGGNERAGGKQGCNRHPVAGHSLAAAFSGPGQHASRKARGRRLLTQRTLATLLQS